MFDFVFSHGDGQAQANLNAALTHTLAFGDLDANTKLALLAIRDRQAVTANSGDACVSLFYSEAALLVNAIQLCPVPLPCQATRLLRSLTGCSVGSEEGAAGAPVPLSISPPPPPIKAAKNGGSGAHSVVVRGGYVIIGILLAGLLFFLPVALVPCDAEQMVLAINARVYLFSAATGLVNTISGIGKAFWEHRAGNK